MKCEKKKRGENGAIINKERIKGLTTAFAHSAQLVIIFSLGDVGVKSSRMLESILGCLILGGTLHCV